jgi:hypothetical protein
MRPFWGHRRIYEENIKMDIEEVGFEEVDWIHLVQYRDC